MKRPFFLLISCFLFSCNKSVEVTPLAGNSGTHSGNHFNAYADTFKGQIHSVESFYLSNAARPYGFDTTYPATFIIRHVDSNSLVFGVLNYWHIDSVGQRILTSLDSNKQTVDSTYRRSNGFNGRYVYYQAGTYSPTKYQATCTLTDDSLNIIYGGDEHNAKGDHTLYVTFAGKR